MQICTPKTNFWSRHWHAWRHLLMAPIELSMLGVIQIIRDTLGGGPHSVTKWHKGEGGGLPVSSDIFSKNFKPFFAFWPVFKGFQDINFGKIIMSHHTGGGGGTDQCHKMTQREGGVKNRSKKCHILFE